MEKPSAQSTSTPKKYDKGLLEKLYGMTRYKDIVLEAGECGRLREPRFVMQAKVAEANERMAEETRKLAEETRKLARATHTMAKATFMIAVATIFTVIVSVITLLY